LFTSLVVSILWSISRNDIAQKNMNKTPLHAAHLELQARMVEFYGWEMPINYGSQIEEHNAVRKDAGMFDVSHMTIVDVTGPQALPYLRYLLA